MRAMVFLLALTACTVVPAPPPTVVRAVPRPVSVEVVHPRCRSADLPGSEGDLNTRLDRIEGKLDALQRCLK